MSDGSAGSVGETHPVRHGIIVATAGTLLASLLLEPVRAFLGSVWRLVTAAPGAVWGVLTASVPVWVLLVTVAVTAILVARLRARAPAIPARPIKSDRPDAPARLATPPVAPALSSGPWSYPDFMDVPPLSPDHERVYVRHGSPRELLDSLDSIPPLKREKVAGELYGGRWIRFAGAIRTLRADEDIYVVFVSDGKGATVHVTFPENKLVHVEPLRAGDRVTVDGQILGFDGLGPQSFEMVHTTITRCEDDGYRLSPTLDRGSEPSR